MTYQKSDLRTGQDFKYYYIVCMYKRFLLSHKYTGVPVDELATMLPALKNALLRYAEDVFCSYEHLAWMEQQNRTAEQNYKRCLEEQECCDAVVGFLQYPEASR